MSATRSQHSATSSTRRRQEAELAAAEERELAAAATAAAAARASRLAAAELAAARAEAAAAAAAEAARAAAAEVEVLRGSANCSVSADGSADADQVDAAAQQAAQRAAQWAAEHARAPRDGAPRGGAHGDGGRNDQDRGLYEIRTVVRDVGPGVGWPTLTKTNYVEWAAIMRIRLQTIKEAWDAIAAARIGSDRARKSMLQALRKEWENLAFKPGEDVDDFALRLNTLLQKMVQFGDDTYDEERAVEKLFRCIPEKYKQMARSIESLLDLSTMSIEEAIGRLKVIDTDEPQPLSGPITTGEKLLLTREEWDAGHGDRKKGESSSTTGGRRRGKLRKARKDGQARLQGDARGGAAGQPKPAQGDTCHNCGRPGHWAKDCRQPRRDQAHVAQAGEEEPALFMAHASIELSPAAPAAAALLHLDEPKAHALLGDGFGNDKTGGWCLDTGATQHMTGRREFFAELDSDVRGSVKFGDASAVEIKGVGSVIFAAKTGEHRLLTGVYYIPALRNSIISLGQLDENGSRVLIESGVLRIWDRHRRLLAKLCDVCVLTKQRRLPFPQQASFRAKEKLELVHGDLCGPVTPATPGGRRYFLLLVDDLSRYMWVVLLGSKGEAADAIRRSQVAAEAECGRKLRVLRTDNGGEFTATEFASYCADEGIQRHYSAPYSPQQNGVVERRNQTVVGMARALLKQREMPAVFWGEAVLTAVYILNRSPTKALDGRTPYEAWHGRKPAVSHLRVFGCLAFAKELGHIGKLDDRSTPGVFIGYSEGSKAYRILDPKTQRVRTSRDVVFTEGRGWAWGKAVEGSSISTYDDFIVEYVHFEAAGGVGSSSSTSLPTSVPTSPSTPVVATPPQPASPRTPAPAVTPPGTSTPAHVEHSPVEFASPLSHDGERIDAYHGGEPLRYRTMENLLGDQPVPGQVPRDLEAQLQLARDDGEPQSFVEAERDAAWRAAMQLEMDAVEKNRTWELADLPRGHRAITLKWVFKLKRDEAGAIVKHKARLVARGFLQQEGVDFDDTFAPVARMESVRLLLALAAQEG
ncbi:hypothetical protein ACQ4PT_068834 [Festuca glaucescens]